MPPTTMGSPPMAVRRRSPQLHGSIQVRLWKDDEELFSADAPGDIRAPQLLADALPEGPEDLVTPSVGRGYRLSS